MSTYPGPWRERARSRHRRVPAAALVATFLFVAAPPADAAPLTVSNTLGPQNAVLSTRSSTTLTTPLLLQDDFEAGRVLVGSAPGGGPSDARWATTNGAWNAVGGAAAATATPSALTVDGGVAAADVTAVLSSPNQIFGALSLGVAVRWSIAAQAGGAGRLEGGMRCEAPLALGGAGSCVLALWSVVGGTERELCSVITYPPSSTSPVRVRLRTTGSDATLSVVGSFSSCSGPVPPVLRSQTGVGVALASSGLLNLGGSGALVQQITAVPTEWTVAS